MVCVRYPSALVGVIEVNGTGYMLLRSFESRATPLEERGLDRWRFPHTARPGARKVLVVGAGGGNDVAVALRAGAEHVVAVEIDPEIYGLGRLHHPEAPYDDSRVTVVIDDARHYAETTAERFDLVVFSHLEGNCNVSLFGPEDLENDLLMPGQEPTSSRVPGDYHLFTRAITVAKESCRYGVAVD